MDSIVFYQPPSSERVSGGAFRKFTPEPIGSEGEDSYFPTLTEILAQSRRKRANEPSVQGHPPAAQGSMGDGERADAFQTSTKACNSLLGETQANRIELEEGPESSQPLRDQNNPDITASKGRHSYDSSSNILDPTAGGDVTLGSHTPARDVGGGDKDTHEGNGTSVRNDSQHRIGNQSFLTGAEASVELDHDRDRKEGSAAAGNVYDIFAEYEKVFAPARRPGNASGKKRDRTKLLADGELPAASESPSGYNTGSARSGISPQGSVDCRPAPPGSVERVSIATAASQKSIKRRIEPLPQTSDSGSKRIRMSSPAAPFAIQTGADASAQARIGRVVLTTTDDVSRSSPSDDGTSNNNEAPLNSMATTQQPGPPPVVPEDNQYIVERLLKRRVRQFHGKKLVKYLVKWEGYGAEHNSWVRERDIHPGLVGTYNESTF